VYIADNGNRRVRKVDKTGTITTFAGNGVPPDPGNPGFGQGENIPATQASLAPLSLLVDGNGIVYVGDGDRNRIRKIDLNGRILTVAGNGSVDFNGDNQQAVNASLNFPISIALDGSGNLYIVDSFHFRLRKVDTNGIITTVMGASQQGTSPSPSGTLAMNALLNLPFGIAIDRNGNIYVGDVGYQVVQVISGASKTIATVAGTGTPGFSGDGGPATAAKLSGPATLAFDSNGNLLIGDNQNSRVRRIVNGTINTIAGNGLYKAFANGGPALQAFLGEPQGLAFDSAGNLYVADTQSNRVERLTPDGHITIVAGTGEFEYHGDGGSAIAAALGNPRDVAVDPAGNLYIADQHNTRVRKVTPDGNISSIACGQLLVVCGPLVDPEGLAVAPDGTVYVADGAGHAIRQIHADSTVSTFAGTGDWTCRGDEGPASQACVNDPQGVVLDPQGNVYIADTGNNLIRKVTTDGVIHTIAGSGQAQYVGDGGSALQASLNGPSKIALGSDGSLYIADTGNHVVRVLTPDGNIATLAGSGMPGFAGDGGVAGTALLNGPAGVVADAAGNVFLSDTLNDRIRVVSSSTPAFAIPSNNAAGPALSFAAVSGNPPTTPQTLSIQLTTGGASSALPFSVTADAVWLLITSSSGTTPATVQVAADARQLAAGVYSGTLTISAPGLQAIMPVQIPVTLTVNAPGTGAGLIITPSNVSLTLSQPSPKATVFLQAAIAVQGTSVRPVTFLATSPAPWLQISGDAEMAQPGTPGVVKVGVDLSAYASQPGTYRSLVNISGPGLQPYAIPVTVTLSGSQPLLALSRESLTFTAVAGGATALPPQSFAVLNQGSGAISWSLVKCQSISTCGTTGGPAWLSFDNTMGTSRSVASQVQVFVRPAGLRAGHYSALVQVFPLTENVLNAPRFLSVLLNVVKPEADPGPAITSSGLVFIGSQNGSAAGSKSIFAYNVGLHPLNFNVYGGTLDHGNWLTFKVPKPPLNPDQPLEVTLQADPSQLSAGIYRAALTFLFETGAVRNVLITFLVAAPGRITSAEKLESNARDPGCTPDSAVQPVITMVGEGNQIPAAVPAVIDSVVIDQSGCALTSGTVAAKIQDPTGALIGEIPLSSLGDGSWEGVWTPQAAGGVTVTAEASAPNSGLSDPVQAEIGDPLDGMLAVSVVASTASQLPGPVAPGTLITVFGKNLGPRGQPVTVGSGSPWTMPLGGVTARLGGVLLPLSFVSQDMLYTIVPFDTQPGTTPQLVVSYTDALGDVSLSVLPVAVSVTDTQPAINTQDYSGMGLGQISNAAGLISPDSPAHPGDSISISCTGLGAVTPAIAAGVPVPNSPVYNVVQPVTVSFNGGQPQAASASLAPGSTGMYNVVTMVPALPAGTNSLTVTAGSATSPPVQIVISQ
jgi:uncharacterized protein (TIGR03437 family)